MSKQAVVGLAVALVVVAVAVAIRGFPAPDSDVIKIGVLAPYNTQPGEGIRAGVKLAVDEINAAGGIDGRLVQVIEQNTEYTAEGARRGYQRLAGKEQVAAVIGVAGDGIFQIMEQLTDYKVPILTTGTGSDRLTELVAAEPEKYKYFFRVMHKSSELGNVTSDFAINCLAREHQIKRFAIMVEDDIWTKYIRDIWVQRLTEAEETEVVFEDTFSSLTKDFSLLFQQIADSHAEFILDASSKVDATSYLKRWAAVKGPPIGGIQSGSGTDRYHQLIGEDGLYVCSVATIPSHENSLTEKSGEWWDKYYDQYGDPAYTSAYSYDAVYVLAEALRGGGVRDSDALVDALEKTDHKGVVARWVFEKDHHPRYGPGFREIPMMQYQETGARGFKVIWPPERATASFIKIER